MAIRTNYLPEDVVTDILSRLPVNSLVRFSCVCQSWSSLLENPGFVTTHLNHSSNQGSHLLLVNEKRSPTACSFSWTSNELLDVSVKKVVEIAYIVGSCKGLICISNDDSAVIIIWNPATRDYKFLPMPRLFPKYPFEPWLCQSFGFHLMDYKVVRIVSSCKTEIDGRPVPSKVEVYSATAGCWKTINATLPYYYMEQKCSVIVKGVPYWLAQEPIYGLDHEAHLNDFVLSFDMGKEVFWQMDLPKAQGWDDMYMDKGITKKLGIYNESLAMMYFYFPYRMEEVPQLIEFWAMEDHGHADQCWSKVLRIGPIIDSLYTVIPLGCWKNQVVMIRLPPYEPHMPPYEEELLLYDPNTEGVKELASYSGMAPITCWTYVESLLPVNQ
ncbi:putative F-box only protein 9 [Morella rubra]|uniref:Putative F-box only protein 9 n=1 Tax=Morella rubra TaxID=262757 RepID=A0A6A1UK25_9ROSI|nr:putative F-box only protein 9 [Morella rubra]